VQSTKTKIRRRYVSIIYLANKDDYMELLMLFAFIVFVRLFTFVLSIRLFLLLLPQLAFHLLPIDIAIFRDQLLQLSL